MKSLVILASGSGTNAVNITKVFAEGSKIKVKALITDRENAPVRAKMEELGVPVYYFPRRDWRETPQTIADFVKSTFSPDLVILAGFNSILKEEFVDTFEGRILNIHPSLLPAYGGPGMWGHNVHEAVLAAGEKESGVTVHIVTNEVDGGPIVLQETVPVLEGDTPATLEARIHEKEYSIFPRAIVKLLRELDGPDNGQHAATADEPEKPASTMTPPPIPPDAQWADALGIPHGPDDFVNPPAPHVPQAPSSAHPQTPHHADLYNGPSSLPPRTPDAVSSGNRATATETSAFGNRAATATEEQPVMPKTYMLWAILSLILCCLPAGIVAVIMSSRVSAKFYEGDYEGARRASRNAEIWIIISFVLGVLSNTLYLPFMFLIGR